MKRRLALVLCAVLAIGGAVWAAPYVGIGGLIAPVHSWGDYPAVTLIPRLLMGQDYGPSVVLLDFWFQAVGEEGQWAQALLSDMSFTFALPLYDLGTFGIYGGPLVAGTFVADTSEEAGLSLQLVPYWGIRLLADGHWGAMWFAVTLDYAPTRGIVPGVAFGVDLGGFGE